MPTKATRWAWKARSIARDVAGKLLDEQWSVDNEGGRDGRPRDVMSLLGVSLPFYVCLRQEIDRSW